MTRSVEIPEAAVAKGAERLWLFRTPIAKTRESCTEQAREVIEAALPYLAPAEPTKLYDWGPDWDQAGYEAAVAKGMPRLPGDHVAATPAGDGGLREALENQTWRWDHEDCRVDLPENEKWAEGVAQGYRNAAADLRRLLATHPAASAVPQPVDREALAKIDNALRNGSRMTAANVGFEKLCRQLGVNRDSLAVLAGEQEQGRG